jgi:hypothetical protein
MKWTDGAFDGQELYFRCPHCGDSERHPQKTHCSVNIFTSIYYCLRCQASGKVSSDEMGLLTKDINFDKVKQLKVDPLYETDSIMEMITEKLRPGPGMGRYSALDRWHIKTQDDTKLDIFKVTNASRELVGYHVRPPDKKYTRTYGQRLLGIPSSIRYNKPWRIVEGPFDCLDPHTDVVVFGFPSVAQAKALYGKPLIICPDGDVFEDYRKLRSFMKPFLWDNNVLIEYVERLPPNTDPDELLPHLRERISADEVRSILTPKRSFFLDQMRPDEILENIIAHETEADFWSKV